MCKYLHSIHILIFMLCAAFGILCATNAMLGNFAWHCSTRNFLILCMHAKLCLGFYVSCISIVYTCDATILCKRFLKFFFLLFVVWSMLCVTFLRYACTSCMHSFQFVAAENVHVFRTLAYFRIL